MTAGLFIPATQICTFALGCALIHAGRQYEAILTRLLAGTALATAALVLITAGIVMAPDRQDYADEITTYAAFAGHPPEQR